jgi:hypothetical protein
MGVLLVYVSSLDVLVLGLGCWLLAAVYYGLMKGRGGRL